MILFESIRRFFPEELRAGQFAKHILKEYVECLALEWIARSPWAAKLTFIGGTNLRLTKDIDRFSEDLGFDCKGLALVDFIRFTEAQAPRRGASALPSRTCGTRDALPCVCRVALVEESLDRIYMIDRIEKGAER